MTDLRGIKRRLEKQNYDTPIQAREVLRREGFYNKGSKRAIAELFGLKENKGKRRNVYRYRGRNF